MAARVGTPEKAAAGATVATTTVGVGTAVTADEVAAVAKEVVATEAASTEAAATGAEARGAVKPLRGAPWNVSRCLGGSRRRDPSGNYC